METPRETSTHLHQGFKPFAQSSLWNVAKVRRYCAGFNVQVQEGPLLELEEMVHTPALPAGAVEAQVVYLPDIYTKAINNITDYMAEVQHIIKEHVQTHAAALSQVHPVAVTIYPTFRLVDACAHGCCVKLNDLHLLQVTAVDGHQSAAVPSGGGCCSSP